MTETTEKIIKYICGNNASIKALNIGKDDLNRFVNRAYLPATTPLMEAVFMGKHKLVKWLVKKGADVNLHDKAYPSPLEIAIRRNNVNIVKTLLENKAKVDTSYIGCPYYYEGSSLLHMVSRNIEILTTYEDPTDHLRELDDEDIDNAWTRDVWDEYQDCVKIVKLLIKYGVDVNKNIKGLTALHWTANDIKNKEGEYVANEAFGLLLNAGANPFSGEYDHTPVYVVVSNGNIETIKKYFSNIDLGDNLKKLLKIIKQSEHKNKKELKQALVITQKIYTVKEMEKKLNCIQGTEEEKEKMKAKINLKLQKLLKRL